MFKKALVLFIILFSISNAQKKNLTMEDVVLNSNISLSPANLSQLKWIPETNYYSYIDKKSSNQTLVCGDVASNKLTEIISLDNLNKLFANYSKEKLQRFPVFNWIDDKNFTFENDSSVYKFDIEKKIVNKMFALNSSAENIEYSDKYQNVAYTIDNNLYCNYNGKNTQISDEKDKNIIFGQAVNREEFGIDKGIFWSPKANYLAFYRMDQTMVKDYPILNIETLPASVEMEKYPMAGGVSHEVTIGVYNFANNKMVYLQTGESKDQYLTCVTWSPDEKYIFVGLLNRDQNYLQLTKFNAKTGEKIKVLFEERDEQFVEPENQLYFLSKEPQKFLWFSKRDGWNHLYEYDIDGNLICQLTKGNWEVTSIVGYNKIDNEILYLSTEESPLERHLYAVNINNFKKHKLTKLSGTHEIIFNNNDYYIDKFNSIDVPRIITINKLTGENGKNILTAENPVKDYNISYQKLFVVKNNKLPDLYARIILPADFDSTKKYPVILYTYGGPHSQEVSNHWITGRYDFWFQYMAQKGYIIFTIDNRGTSFRGSEFEQATFRKLGTVEIEDQMRGVNYLKSLSYVDTSRLGVYGWSYGGFMTTSLMLRTNNTFKVGACGGAVIDWRYYEVMYTERYMDTPQTNPDGYNTASLLNYVNKLNGKLLLVHGTSDVTVPWQNTLLFVKKAVSLNRPLDYFPYPGHTHGVTGKDALHLYNKITDYFLRNL